MNEVKFLNIRRCVAVFMAMLITVLSLSYTNNNHANATNSSITYFVYDAKTAEKIPNRNYILTKLGSSDNKRTVIGEDERVIDWTKSGVVKIMNSSSYIGSGFVVSDHVIATAAHCAYNEKISEILLFDNSGNVTLHATPVESHIPYNYCKNNEDETYDYALITVKEDLSDYACFDLGVPLNCFANSKPVVSVTGFPGTIGKPGEKTTVNTHTKHMMYTGNGIVKKINDSNLIFYEADTIGGNSGGPVYITESFKGKTYYTVIAIHAYGTHDDHMDGNHGTCMNTDLIHFYNNKNIQW